MLCLSSLLLLRLLLLQVKAALSPAGGIASKLGSLVG
jgi:hypothetical protein